MRIENIWFKGILAISLYISCAIITIFMVYGSVYLLKGKDIPIRIYVMASIGIANWLVIAYYSEEVFWCTLVKLICYSLALFSLFLSLLGLAFIIKIFIDDLNQISLMNSFLLMVVGGMFICGFVKMGNSQLLNRK